MIPMHVVSVTLGPGKPVVLTPAERAEAETTLRRWFGVAKKLTQAQCDRLNRQAERVHGPGNYGELFPGWYTFCVNAKGEYVDGAGDYPNRDAAIWNFHHMHLRWEWTAEDLEEHRRYLGFPASAPRRAA